MLRSWISRPADVTCRRTTCLFQGVALASCPGPEDRRCYAPLQYWSQRPESPRTRDGPPHDSVPYCGARMRASNSRAFELGATRSHRSVNVASRQFRRRCALRAMCLRRKGGGHPAWNLPLRDIRDLQGPPADSYESRALGRLVGRECQVEPFRSDQVIREFHKGPLAGDTRQAVQFRYLAGRIIASSCLSGCRIRRISDGTRTSTDPRDVRLRPSRWMGRRDFSGSR